MATFINEMNKPLRQYSIFLMCFERLLYPTAMLVEYVFFLVMNHHKKIQKDCFSTSKTDQCLPKLPFGETNIATEYSHLHFTREYIFKREYIFVIAMLVYQRVVVQP